MGENEHIGGWFSLYQRNEILPLVFHWMWSEFLKIKTEYFTHTKSWTHLLFRSEFWSELLKFLYENSDAVCFSKWTGEWKRSSVLYLSIYSWAKNSWHQNSYGFYRNYDWNLRYNSGQKQMDSAYNFCEKMQNKTSSKTYMHKKCKTQVVHLKINPVFDTVKIITIYLFASFKADI